MVTRFAQAMTGISFEQCSFERYFIRKNQKRYCKAQYESVKMTLRKRVKASKSSE